MLISVPSGIGSEISLRTSCAVKEAATPKSKTRPKRKSISRFADCWETAMAGSPRTMPSKAAATVPE